MQREEQNRKLAEWVEPKGVGRWEDGQWIDLTPDFFSDEAASAALLEKIRRPLLVSDWPGCEGWRVDIGVEYHNGPPKGPTDLDRKTAIALAALRLIEALEVDRGRS